MPGGGGAGVDEFVIQTPEVSQHNELRVDEGDVNPVQRLALIGEHRFLHRAHRSAEHPPVGAILSVLRVQVGHACMGQIRI